MPHSEHFQLCKGHHERPQTGFSNLCKLYDASRLGNFSIGPTFGGFKEPTTKTFSISYMQFRNFGKTEEIRHYNIINIANTGHE